MASTSTAEPLSAMEESPNWLEMPHELMANILRRLGDEEILNNAQKVCTTWWRICKDPGMWKVIAIHNPVDDDDVDYDLVALTKQAVHLSCGELIDISISGFVTDDLLDYIVLRSSKLNSFCLTDCYNITNSGLTRALKIVPKLEKLQISYTSWRVKYAEVIIPNCPQLKSFKLDKVCLEVGIANDDDALAIAKNMPELRHLQVFGNKMTNTGLQAILDGCPHLESLDVHTCYNINIFGDEVKLCMERIKNFKCPDDSIENCVFLPRIHDYVDSDDEWGDYEHYDDGFYYDDYDDPCNYI